MAQAELMRKAMADSLKVHLRKTPFSKITVDDICESAGIGRRSFYRYFKDKYDLLNWLYDNEFCSKLPKSPDKTIWDYFPAICRHLYNDREFFVNAFSVTGQNSFRDYCSDLLYPLLMNDFGEVFTSEAEAHFAIKRITEASFDGFQWWLSQEPCMPPEEYAEYARGVFTRVARGIADIDKRRLPLSDSR